MYEEEEEEKIKDEEGEDDVGDGSKGEDSTSFASDFFRSGTDWSCLIEPDDSSSASAAIVNVNVNSKRQKTTTLRQVNLFQSWGLINHHKPPPSPPPFAGGRDEIAAASTSTNTKSNQTPRPCPFYKKISGTPFTVDAFRYGSINACSAYFLTHFHADHYIGLNKSWSHGPIYCTPITARLITMSLYVNPMTVRPLELGTEYVVQGIKVTMLEANHCPGAALIHFRLPDGQCHLHTGDFRASNHMQTYPILLRYKVNLLYLDTTYCNPKYRFPAKEDVLDFVVGISKTHIKAHPKTLIVVGAYSIGKECVYLAISKALGLKIYANASRRRLLHSFGWPELSDNICTDAKATPLHVLPISSLKFEVLEKYLQSYGGHYSAVLAFRPTGWTYSESNGSQLELIKPKSNGNISIYGVPYSEHSSFTELQDFIKFLRPRKIIPTVNVGSSTNRDKMQSYFQQWLKD